jgi:signal transduction histidine kinase
MKNVSRGRLDSIANNAFAVQKHEGDGAPALDGITLSMPPMHHAGSVVLGDCVVLADVDDRKCVAAELLLCQQELRSVSAMLIDVQERERLRIAADLHDGIGQSLSFIKFGLEQSLGDLRSGSRESSLLMLETLLNRLKDAIGDVRRVAMNVRPSTLDDLGIVATLCWLFREFELVFAGIEVEHDIDIDETGIANEQKVVLYRVVQEAINNSAKHSGATRINIFLGRTANQIELAISDNGCGFDPRMVAASATRNRGLGLASIRARAMSVGGTHVMRTTVGHGVEIVVTLPISQLNSESEGVHNQSAGSGSFEQREVAGH